MKKSIRALSTNLIFIVLVVFLAACNPSQNDPAKVIEAYIRALSGKDQARLSSLSCSEWESSALLEADSLVGVGSTIQDLSCSQTSQESSTSFVACTGVLALDYNGEAQQIDLSTRTYVARQEAGEWRMCGYH